MHDLGVEFEPVMSGDTGILRTEYRRFVQSVLEVLAPFVERRYTMKTTEVSSDIHKELGITWSSRIKHATSDTLTYGLVSVPISW